MLKKLFNFLLRYYSVRENVSIGKGVHVGPFSIISSPKYLRIGDNSYIGKSCTIQVNGEIGRGVLIANNVGIVGRLDHEYRKPGVLVRGDEWIGTSPALNNLRENHVTIGDDVWIGFGAVVLSNVVIGDGVIVGAAAVVTHDIEDYAIVVGNPARIVGYRFGGNREDIAKHKLEIQTRYGSKK